MYGWMAAAFIFENFFGPLMASPKDSRGGGGGEAAAAAAVWQPRGWPVHIFIPRDATISVDSPLFFAELKGSQPRSHEMDTVPKLGTWKPRFTNRN